MITSVLFASNQSQMLNEWQKWLQREIDIRTIGMATTGQDTIKTIYEQKPDVVIIQMPLFQDFRAAIAEPIESEQLTEHAQTVADHRESEKIFPQIGGLTSIRHLRHYVQHVSSQTKLILASPCRDDQFVQAALLYGIDAYLLLDSSRNEVVRAVRSVLSGHRFLATPFFEHAIDRYLLRREFYLFDPYRMLDIQLDWYALKIIS